MLEKVVHQPKTSFGLNVILVLILPCHSLFYTYAYNFALLKSFQHNIHLRNQRGKICVSVTLGMQQYNAYLNFFQVLLIQKPFVHCDKGNNLTL